MVTLDRIRLTGLLRKSPANVGLFYVSVTSWLVTLVGRQPLGGFSGTAQVSTLPGFA
jgi:hypothetical protein